MQEINNAFVGLDLRDMSKADEVAEILDRFGLRWNVSTQPVFFFSAMGDKIPTNIRAIVRDDNNRAFAACKDGYTPFQNSRLAELILNIAGKAGYAVHSGGMFNGGGKVYIQLDTATTLDGIGENRTQVKGYVTGINSHDGTHSLKWGNVTTTICCGNTYAMARRALQQSARHTKSIFNNVDLYLSELEGLHEDLQKLYRRFREMASNPIGEKEITRVVKEITGFDPTATEQSTYTQNRASDLLISIGSEIKQKGSTEWGLFSGVTHYTQYRMPNPKRENGVLESKYTGSAFEKDNRALEVIS